MGSDANSAGGGGDNKPSLPKLLASLALGARSVNSLPFARSINDNDDDGDENDDDDDILEDEFSFRMSLPEFAALNNEARRSLSSLLCKALEGIGSAPGNNHNDNYDDDNDTEMYEFDDPELWDRCADACDALHDRVTTFIAQSKKQQQGGGEYESLAMAISNVSQRARTNASGAYGRMVAGLADMEKPQSLYQGFVTQPPQNSRGKEPFVPTIVYDGEKQGKLDGGGYTREGHGLDARFDGVGGNAGDGEGDMTRRKYSPDMIAPSHHYDHPYREEIEALEYRPWQLDVAGIEKKEKITVRTDKNDHGVWIGTEEDLAKLATRIMEGQSNGEIHEIALDLEAHSHRTFAGFVCLVQLSIRRPKSSAAASGQQQQTTPAPPDITTGYDFLIDALSLRHVIPTHLGPVLASPHILKIMHGADSDVPWLQRDFGCYIVNLFDTGRASRALKFPSAGLAFLLRKYAGIEAEKVHQLSDWRRRPLLEDMREYAVSDTRYLLDIYDQLRLELNEHSSPEVSITSVLDRSKQVCLIRYDKVPFRPSGYLTIMDGGRRRRNTNKNSKVTSELSPQQESALKALYDWRDRTARHEDESTQYVCSNAALVRIASNRPVTVAALQRLVNPLPPLVMRRSQEILDAIKASTAVSAESNSGEKSKGEETAVKKANLSKVTTVPQPPPSTRNREMLSPILGSEALYQRAGWMTPAGQIFSGVSEESDEENGIQKFLDVDAANQGFVANQYSSHGIEMSPPSLEKDSDAAMEEDNMISKKTSRGVSTEGLGTAGAALGSTSSASVVSIHEDIRVAQLSANLIRKEMIKSTEKSGGKFGHGFSLIDLIRPMPLSEDVDFETDQDATDSAAGNNDTTPSGVASEEDEMTIPKSMREIYSLSNANRRRTGKDKAANTPTPKPLQFPDKIDRKNIEKMKEDDIQGAEAIIASRAGNAHGPGGYFGGASGSNNNNNSKRQRTAPGKEGDIKLMTKMGWVKDKKDAESLAIVASDLQQNSSGDNNKDGRGGGGNHNHHGSSQSHYKKSSGGERGGRGGGSAGGGGGSFDYYSSMGAGMGALDPNAAPSKNPFFGGVATSAASMLHGGESKGGKSHKRNKKR